MTQEESSWWSYLNLTSPKSRRTLLARH